MSASPWKRTRSVACWTGHDVHVAYSKVHPSGGKSSGVLVRRVDWPRRVQLVAYVELDGESGQWVWKLSQGGQQLASGATRKETSARAAVLRAVMPLVEKYRRQYPARYTLREGEEVVEGSGFVAPPTDGRAAS